MVKEKFRGARLIDPWEATRGKKRFANLVEKDIESHQNEKKEGDPPH